MNARFSFGPCELDPRQRRLLVGGSPVALTDRQCDVLMLLVTRAQQVVSKDDLLQAGWKDVAVGDNSVEQVISALRRALGPRPDGGAFIETVSRRGYRLAAEVARSVVRESDATLDALLSPHRAFLEGRAALETLEAAQIARARAVFEQAIALAPEHASGHVGLANACAMQFEMTRADRAPDTAALQLAAQHAREACRLDPQSGEAWATLGFILDRTGDRADAPAAVRRAIALEPDNWRHHFRLSYAAWGEERLREARRTLNLLPDFPLAHWLAATVLIARQAFSEAERELEAGQASLSHPTAPSARFSPVAVHWLRGLLYWREGEEANALAAFERELALESAGQLYARECAANTHYAIGALHLHRGRRADAAAAFKQAIDRVSAHHLARIGLMAATSGVTRDAFVNATGAPDSSIDAAMVRAVGLTLAGDPSEGATLLERALAASPPGVSGWIVPVEPLLHVTSNPGAWTTVLVRLRARAT